LIGSARHEAAHRWIRSRRFTYAACFRREIEGDGDSPISRGSTSIGPLIRGLSRRSNLPDFIAPSGPEEAPFIYYLHPPAWRRRCPPGIIFPLLQGRWPILGYLERGTNGREFPYRPACKHCAEFKLAMLMRWHLPTPDVLPGNCVTRRFARIGHSIPNRMRGKIPRATTPFFQERSIISVAEVVVFPLFPIVSLPACPPLCRHFELAASLATHFVAGTEGQAGRWPEGTAQRRL
jgi:hypothetical protein